MMDAGRGADRWKTQSKNLATLSLKTSIFVSPPTALTSWRILVSSIRYVYDRIGHSPLY